MLDQKDLELLQNLMQEVVKESEQNIPVSYTHLDVYKRQHSK